MHMKWDVLDTSTWETLIVCFVPRKKKCLSDDMVSFAFVTSQDVCHLEGQHVGCLH